MASTLISWFSLVNHILLTTDVSRHGTEKILDKYERMMYIIR